MEVSKAPGSRKMGVEKEEKSAGKAGDHAPAGERRGGAREQLLESHFLQRSKLSSDKYSIFPKHLRAVAQSLPSRIRKTCAPRSSLSLKVTHESRNGK